MGSKLSQEEKERYAEVLDRAFLSAQEVPRLTREVPELSIPDAYEIQDHLIGARLSRGEKIVGWKMGLTSRAKMKQMGVDSPIYGVLTDAMESRSGVRYSLQGRIHAKIEPEIAFRTRKELSGPLDFDQAMDAVEWVSAALEIIDSRYLNFEFQLPDVIADNCSSTGFVLGEIRKKPAELDLGNLGMALWAGGKAVEFASSAAIFGHPVDSLRELSRMLGARGKTLPAGAVVLAGAATAAIALEVGSEVRAEVQDLGSVLVPVVG